MLKNNLTREFNMAVLQSTLSHKGIPGNAQKIVHSLSLAVINVISKSGNGSWNQWNFL